MGLTVHFTITAKLPSRTARATTLLLSQMRALAAELPFMTIGKQYFLADDACNPAKYRNHDRARNLAKLMLTSRCARAISMPWNKKKNFSDVIPAHIAGFSLSPGLGAESCDIALARFNDEVQVRYTPYDDARFITTTTGPGWSQTDFNPVKFQAWARRQGLSPTVSAHEEIRTIEIPQAGRLSGYDFCKTEYAMNEENGGLPNFITCHVMLLTLLFRFQKLPGVKVKINDEGRYGSSNYSDDWREANAAGRAPTYVNHPPTYSVRTLLDTVGAAPADVQRMFEQAREHYPTTPFKSLDACEFKRARAETINAFLQLMTALARRNRKAYNAKRAAAATT